MSKDCLSVAAWTERGITSTDRILPQNLIRPATSLFDRLGDIASCRNVTQEGVGTGNAIDFAGEPSRFFRDRVVADRMGAILAGTSRPTSFGLTPTV
jgi:hypothetical protein